MIVISDTSPVNYLVLIGHADVLMALFGRVVIPNAVFVELQRPGTPAIVHDWVADAPNWLEVRSATGAAPDLNLGAGETEAIRLAEELQANLLLIDDKLARSTAEARGFNVTGIINVLQSAAARDLLDLPTAIALLRSGRRWLGERRGMPPYNSRPSPSAPTRTPLAVTSRCSGPRSSSMGLVLLM